MKLTTNELLKLNLQYFADEGTGTDEQGEGETNTKVDDNGGKGEDDKPLTVEDIQKMIQSETDKVRTEYSKKLKQKDSEIEEVKKSKMSDEEKFNYENQTLQEQLEERERTLKEKENDFNRSQIELKTIDLLKENELPLEAKSFLADVDEEKTTENVQAFKTMFDDAIQKEIQGRIGDTSKEHNDSAITGNITVSDFKKMSYSDRVAVYNENPELYKELSK